MSFLHCHITITLLNRSYLFRIITHTNLLNRDVVAAPIGEILAVFLCHCQQNHLWARLLRRRISPTYVALRSSYKTSQAPPRLQAILLPSRIGRLSHLITYKSPTNPYPKYLIFSNWPLLWCMTSTVNPTVAYLR
ncbi:MAG: hypothetical protein ACK53Y_07170, partial [bacterium]